MKDLTGKHIIITGASGGIGRSLAYKLAQQQAQPILIARNEEKLKRMAQDIKAMYQVDVEHYAIDITNKEEWKQILRSFSNIDALINNAGVGYFENFHEADWLHIEKMIQLNMEALMYTTYYLLPAMKQQHPAHIVNIASQAGKIATPKTSVYSATKAGVISFSNALRLELKKENVSVTSVNIGPTKTNFFETADPKGTYQENVSKYMLDPEKVAIAITQTLFTKKREINLPHWMNVGSKVYQLFPSMMEVLLKSSFNKK